MELYELVEPVHPAPSPKPPAPPAPTVVKHILGAAESVIVILACCA
jgi:hypothetical protein